MVEKLRMSGIFTTFAVVNTFLDILFQPTLYNGILVGMAVLAVVVWCALTRIEAPYGMAYRKGWGISLPNKAGWVLMELPAFAGMAALMCLCPEGLKSATAGSYVCGALFLLHYFRRTFIFPLLMRGKSRMPLAIALMGAVFNTINAYLLGGWLFILHPLDYPLSWLWSWQFIAGTALFLAGMGMNWQADRIVRHLRRPGDSRHYIPRGGMFRYVTAASYLGELTEWCGYALLTWSWAGALFLLWTAANLVPRAAKLHKRYLKEFGKEYAALHRRRIIPFVY